MTVLKNFIAFLISLGMAGTMASSIAAERPPLEVVKSYYARVPYPTEAEGQALQELAMSQGTDYFGILKDLPDDQQAWSKIFALSLRFKEFDRSAQVYGYTLFAVFYYFMDYAGEARFADLINAQPPEVRQRVHDFLYYDVVSDDPEVMKNNERVLRRDLKLIYPRSYSFDPSLGSSPRK
ncbi:hypothetical protein LP419_34430 [Massilia sp. H-1]|nr:hypothetical protein LP419_34430 [Massilia sp. H-1]